MTKEQFEKEYAEASGLTVEEYSEMFESKPCDCGDELCKGWASYTRAFPEWRLCHDV